MNIYNLCVYVCQRKTEREVARERMEESRIQNGSDVTRKGGLLGCLHPYWMVVSVQINPKRQKLGGFQFDKP